MMCVSDIDSSEYQQVCILLRSGANKNKVDTYRQNALHLASTEGHAAVVQVLLDSGMDPMARDMDDHTPYDIAGIHTV
jgi:ankyrin repeat protein